MREEKIGKNTIEFYDSLEEVGSVRHHKFNHFLMIDSGLGSDLEDYDKHLSKLEMMIARNDNKNAVIQIETMRANINFVIQNISPKNLAFAVLVKKINGNEYNDLSDNGLEKLLSELDRIGVTVGMLERWREEVKKKIEYEHEQYFGATDSVEVKQYYTKLAKQNELTLREIVGEKVDSKTQKEIDDYFYLIMKPKIYWGSKGIEVKHKMAFERICVIMSQQVHVDPEQMSALKFYVTLNELNTQNKPQAKAHAK